MLLLLPLQGRLVHRVEVRILVFRVRVWKDGDGGGLFGKRGFGNAPKLGRDTQEPACLLLPSRAAPKAWGDAIPLPSLKADLHILKFSCQRAGAWPAKGGPAPPKGSTGVGGGLQGSHIKRSLLILEEETARVMPFGPACARGLRSACSLQTLTCCRGSRRTPCWGERRALRGR